MPQKNPYFHWAGEGGIELLFILDAGALINASSPSFPEGDKYATTPDVDAEIKDMGGRILVQQEITAGRLRIMQPDKKFIMQARESASALNSRLSPADISVVALAFQLKAEKKKFTVITDDYSVQNILLKECMDFDGVIRGKIKKVRSFR